MAAAQYRIPAAGPRLRRWRRLTGAAMVVAAAATVLGPPMASAAAGRPARDTEPSAALPGALLSWGFQPGIGDGNDSRGDALTPVAAALGGERVSQVQAGCRHAVALAADGKVLTWGNNGSGQLGRTVAGSFTEKPGAVVFPGRHARIISVAAGCFFSLALTSSGQVLSWGANEAGELGAGETPSDDPSRADASPPPRRCADNSDHGRDELRRSTDQHRAGIRVGERQERATG